MPYYDEDTFRRAFGSDRVDGYFPTSSELQEAIEMAEDRVYSALQEAGHKDKPPSFYSTPADAPAVVRRACYLAVVEEAYTRHGLTDNLVQMERQLEIFDKIATGAVEIPGVEVDSTTRAVGGVSYTEKGVSSTSSARRHARVFGRSEMYGNY